MARTDGPLKRLGLAALGSVAGRRRWQPLFRRMHAAALIGRNFGEGDFVRSGELNALEYVALASPGATVVLDVGANDGGWAFAAAAAFPNASVFAFEPAPDVFAGLAARCEGTRVHPIQSAVSREPGLNLLHRFEGMTGLSSLEARDLADHGIAVRDVVSVVTTTVDEFCSSRGIEAVDLLKVDAEGHDLAVLEGAATMLREARIAFVQFEFGGGNIDARTFIRDFLHVLGGSYAVSRVLFDGLEPVVYSEREEVFVTANYLAERRR